jgi:phosphoglycerate dehydrogenase-like enzyme
MTLSVLLRSAHEGLRQLLQENEDVHVLTYDGDRLPEEAEDAEVLVVASGSDVTVDEQVRMMARLPRLRLVQTLSAGVEAWEGRLPEGVQLSNARGAHGGATAEWAVTALLAVYRELPGFVLAQQDGRWDAHQTDTLDGKRVLVLGAGDLAVELRRRAEPFGAEVSFVGRRARQGVHGFDELDGLLPDADAVVVMLPLTDATRGLVDADVLRRMADNAVLVNAGRGPIVDTDALLAELRSGRLRAALDVTEPEPLPDGHPLWSAPGLLLTPHVAGSTIGWQERAFAVAARQIEQFAAGRAPDNLQ